MAFRRWLLGFMSVWLATGCSAVELTLGDKGTDISRIQPGVTRTEVEALLGSAVKEWKSNTGVRYRVYGYDSGFRPEVAQGATLGALTVMTGGMMELVGRRAVEQTRTRSRLVVSYDDRDVVLGVFGEFDEIPQDGRSFGELPAARAHHK